MSLRLCSAGGRLVCLLSLRLPGAAGPEMARELVLVASSRPLSLRRLTVYRGTVKPTGSDDYPRAA
jgi:hypothetical protein